MKLNMLLLITLAAALAACSTEEQSAAPTESDMEAPATAETEAPETVEDEMVDDIEREADTTLAEVQEWRDEALLDHMHAHAEQLDDLNFALDDGDLFRASTSAYWLARHDVVEGLPNSLQPYVAGMRDAAREVEAAEDIETAKDAAKRVGEACQGCHDAADVSIT